MTRTKSLALVFYVGAALAGAAVGAAADRVSFKSPSSAPPDRKTFRKRFFDQLHLTSAQRDSATFIFDARDKQLEAVMLKHKAVLDSAKAEHDSIFAEGRRRISQVLTADQKAIYDQMQREREKSQRTEKK